MRHTLIKNSLRFLKVIVFNAQEITFLQKKKKKGKAKSPPTILLELLCVPHRSGFTQNVNKKSSAKMSNRCASLLKYFVSSTNQVSDTKNLASDCFQVPIHLSTVSEFPLVSLV